MGLMLACHQWRVYTCQVSRVKLVSNTVCCARSTTSSLMSQDRIQNDFQCPELQHYLFKVTRDWLVVRMTLENMFKSTHMSQWHMHVTKASHWFHKSAHCERVFTLPLSVSPGSALCIYWVQCAEGPQAGTLEPCGFRGGTSWGQKLWRLRVDDFEQVEKGYVHFYKETASVYHHISLARLPL